ncbi:UNVERIFIED_ORG: hypothetical protein [Escherichia phage CMSTMSU]
MKNKEWREIQTSRPENKEYSTLLDINYDTGKKYIEFTQSNSTKPLAYFNMGGTSQVDSNNWTTFTNGTGVFEFGSNYFYELKIMIREVSDSSGEIVSLPYNSKHFSLKVSSMLITKVHFSVQLVQVRFQIHVALHN